MLHLRNIRFSRAESDIFEVLGPIIMLPCGKTCTTNAKVAGNLKRWEHSSNCILSENYFLSLQLSWFTAEMYLNSLTSSRAPWLMNLLQYYN